MNIQVKALAPRSLMQCLCFHSSCPLELCYTLN